MPHEAAGLGIGPPPALALDYGESQRRIWTRRRVSEARRSTSAGSSRGRTILSWRRVCDDWVARLDRALARESRARCGRLRGSGCRARFASARARLVNLTGSRDSAPEPEARPWLALCDATTTAPRRPADAAGGERAHARPNAVSIRSSWHPRRSLRDSVGLHFARKSPGCVRAGAFVCSRNHDSDGS